MPFIVIHNHVHLDILNKLVTMEAKLNQLLKITTMSQEILDQLTAKADAADASLNAIKADIAKIKDSLPAEGGLTAEEVAALSARLDSLAGNAAALDAENE